MAVLKSRSQVIHDFRDLRARELHGVDADQAQKIVIEINQVEFDASATDARNGHLATAESQRLQRRFEHRAAHGIEHKVNPLPIRQRFHLDGQIFGHGSKTAVFG
jgi:hypothetical protein